jgi:hypothetical protein
MDVEEGLVALLLQTNQTIQETAREPAISEHDGSNRFSGPSGGTRESQFRCQSCGPSGQAPSPSTMPGSTTSLFPDIDVWAADVEIYLATLTPSHTPALRPPFRRAP